MSWYSIREYTDRMGISTSTVRRQIAEGRLFAKKFGRNWYIQPMEGRVAPAPDPVLEEAVAPLPGATRAREGGELTSVVEFSSKALHHYLLMSEKLVAEKDARLAERDTQIAEKKQEIAELKGYVKLLEGELTRQREKPEGWN